MKQCTKCKIDKTLADFYSKGGARNTELSSHCKSCQNHATKVRQQHLKAEALKYKGNKCQHCGVEGHPAIFDFHHIDPSEKDFAIARRKSKNITDEIKKELDKCILLCSNCHRIEHATY